MLRPACPTAKGGMVWNPSAVELGCVLEVAKRWTFELTRREPQAPVTTARPHTVTNHKNDNQYIMPNIESFKSQNSDNASSLSDTGARIIHYIQAGYPGLSWAALWNRPASRAWRSSNAAQMERGDGDLWCVPADCAQSRQHRLKAVEKMDCDTAHLACGFENGAFRRDFVRRISGPRSGGPAAPRYLSRLF
jgi:hypothetical protein